MVVEIPGFKASEVGMKPKQACVKGRCIKNR